MGRPAQLRGGVEPLVGKSASGIAETGKGDVRPATVDDHPVERYFRDVRVTTLYEGTSQIQKLIIGREFAVTVTRLAATGLDVTVRDDEAATLWSKLSVLAPIALVTTWTAAPYREAKAGHWDEVAAVAREIVAAARADGVDLDEAALLAMLERLPDMRSSMQKDAAAGRPIELDAIGGAVLRAAERGGTEAPVTARLVAALRARTG